MTVMRDKLETLQTNPGVPELEPWDRRRDRKAAALMFLVVWAVYLATATYTIAQTNDTRSASVAAWSIGHRGELALPGAWDVDPRNYWGVEGQDGRTYSNRFPGVIAWGVPFYAAQRAVSGPDDPGHPFLIDFRPGGVAAATAAALAVTAAFVLARRLVDRRLALMFAAVVGFATPFWSVAADALWPHAITSLMLLVTMLSLSSDRREGFALAGSVAYAITVRPHLAIAHGVMGLWTLARRRWRASVVMVIGGVAGIGATALYSKLVFGTWLPSAGFDAGARVDRVIAGSWGDTVMGFVWAMAAPSRGLFIWSPFLLLLVPFLRRGWRATPDWGRIAAIAGVAYLFLQLRQNAWNGGGSFFAYRLPIEMLLLASPWLLRTWQVAISRERLLRRVFTLVLAATTVVQVFGALDLHNREGNADWDRIVDRVRVESGPGDDR